MTLEQQRKNNERLLKLCGYSIHEIRDGWCICRPDGQLATHGHLTRQEAVEAINLFASSSTWLRDHATAALLMRVQERYQSVAELALRWNGEVWIGQVRTLDLQLVTGTMTSLVRFEAILAAILAALDVLEQESS